MAKVLALVSFKIFPPHMGGQKGVALFYDNLSHYHQVFMAASKDNVEVSEALYPVQPFLYPNKKIAGNFFLLNRLKHWIKKENIDCIIAEHSYTGWLAYLLKKLTGKPFLLHSHNLESYRFRQMQRSWWKLYKRYEKWIHQKADHSFFISEHDLEIALNEFKLDESKCSVAPYGIESSKTITGARKTLQNKFDIKSKYVFYFNGTMDYEPNIEAVENLIGRLNPILQKKGLDYTIVISGKRLSTTIQTKIKKSQSMLYLDFVEDLKLFYQGSDLFLNTVINDSGVKTKVIEAIANKCTTVSTKAGATGIKTEACGNKLIIVPNNDWNIFAGKMIESLDKKPEPTPAAFYTYYSWENIAAAAAAKLEETIRNKK
jgi:polysaccharide biosynthesis protein PslH